MVFWRQSSHLSSKQEPIPIIGMLTVFKKRIWSAITRRNAAKISERISPGIEAVTSDPMIEHTTLGRMINTALL